jgi:uncharacterized membrane protein YpjA
MASTGSDSNAPLRWTTPVPRAIETIGLRFVWAVVAVNLAGTAFGFWFYRHQFAETPPVMLPFVPDSPGATLLIALALALWALGRPSEYVAVLAFFGNLILGLWTPFVLVVFSDASVAQSGLAMHTFMIVSHLGMVLQALVLHRIAAFRLRAIAVATAWYTLNLTVDYFYPVVGAGESGFLPATPHHTLLPVTRESVVAGTATAFQIAALGAVLTTVLAVFLATSIRIGKLRDRPGR